MYISPILKLDILSGNGILLPKLFWPTVRKKCSSDRGKTFEIQIESQEFAKWFLRPNTLLEQ